MYSFILFYAILCQHVIVLMNAILLLLQICTYVQGSQVGEGSGETKGGREPELELERVTAEDLSLHCVFFAPIFCVFHHDPR